MVYPADGASDGSLHTQVNNFSTLLVGSVTAVQTSMTLSTTSELPGTGLLTMGTEAIEYSANATATGIVSGMTRGLGNTPASIHNAGITVYANIQEAHHNRMAAEVIGVTTDLRNVINADLDDSAGVTATASSLSDRVDMIATQLKNVISGTDWKDTPNTSLNNLGSLQEYKRPVLQWISVTEVDVENNTGTANETKIVFPDGESRSVTEDTTSVHKFRRFIITATAEFTAGTEDSGLLSGLSEVANTWYSIYAVKSVIDTTKFVLVGSKQNPVQSDVGTNNANFGADSWVYLGSIANGDNSGSTGDILDFRQVGNITMLSNSTTGNADTGRGIRMATSASATTITFTYATGELTSAMRVQQDLAWFQCATGNVTGRVFVSHSAGGALLSNRSNASFNQSRLLLNPRKDVKVNSPSGPIDIFLIGWVDRALGIASNPLI